MNCKTKFLACDQCKNILQVICSESNASYECCGSALKELVPNTSEGASEKHLPVAIVNGQNVTVNVGSVLHPMTDEHNIAWVYLETKKGGQRTHFNPTDQPTANFTVAEGDTPIAAYAFCNLHGFWKCDISAK